MKNNPTGRMNQFMQPIDQLIMMCDNTDDILMLASVTAMASKNMFVSVLGRDGAIHVLNSLVESIRDE